MNFNLKNLMGGTGENKPSLPVQPQTGPIEGMTPPQTGELGGMMQPSTTGVTPPTTGDPETEFDPAQMDTFVAELKRKYQKYINTKELTESQVNQYKEKILRDLYDFLTKNGIDPMDRTQISAFLADLEEQDPDVYDLVKMAIDSIMKFVETPVDMGPEMPNPLEGGQTPSQEQVGPMSKFSNLKLK